MKQSEKSRSERRGIAFLQVLLLVAVVVGLCCLLFRVGEEKPVEGRGKASATENSSPVTDTLSTTRKKEAESFSFDPNTADSLTLGRLGLSPYQIRNIYRYRAKGGQYHRPEDFKKLYGLTVAQWRHLEPLIEIGEDYRYLADTPEAYDPSKAYVHNPRQNDNGNPDAGTRTYPSQENPYRGAGRDTTLYPNKLQSGQTVNLNLSDTTALKRIPGIGTHYARRIVQYRDKLGGFSSLSQLDEIEDLPLGIEQYLELDATKIRRMRLNHATLRELNAHPYIGYYQARAIVNRIRQVGPFHSLQELSRLEEFDEADLQRLAPYLDFTE